MGLTLRVVIGEEWYGGLPEDVPAGHPDQGGAEHAGEAALQHHHVHLDTIQVRDNTSKYPGLNV